MGYPLSTSELATLNSLVQAENSLGIYKFILFHTSNFTTAVASYQNVTHALMNDATPKSGVDKSVWLWARGAFEVNDPNESTFFSDYIRNYTETQYSIRYGSALPNGELQTTSNNIAIKFGQDIVQQNNGFLPSLQNVGQVDAGEAASEIFDEHAIDGAGNFSPWAGTTLFAFLGEDSYFQDWILTTDTTVQKKIEGTYDLISVATVAHQITNLWDAWWASGDLEDTIQNNSIGEAATLTLLENLRDDATEFFQDVYDLPDIGIFQIGGDLPLYGDSYDPTGGDYAVHPNYILGSLYNDTSIQTFSTKQGALWYNSDIVHAGLGDDVIFGSKGGDLVDGGKGSDTIDYANYVDNNSIGLVVTMETFTSTYSALSYRALVEMPPPQGEYLLFDDNYVFDIERYNLSQYDDAILYEPDVALSFDFNGKLGFDTISYESKYDDSFSYEVEAVEKHNGTYAVTKTYHDIIDNDTGLALEEIDVLDRIERVAHAEKRIENTVGNDARGLNIAEIDLGYVAVFILDQANGLTFGVHYQLYDFNGDAIGNTERVSQVDPYRKKEYNPDVTTTADGFIVVWDSEKKRHAGKKTLARAFDVDEQQGVVTVTKKDQKTVFVNEVDNNNDIILGWKTTDYDQTVDTLTNGKVVVVAEAEGGTVAGSPGIVMDLKDIIVNIIDGSTADPIGTKAVVNTDQADYQTDPSVTALSSGEFVTTWTSSDGDSTGIFFQRMSESGGAVAKEGSETRVNVNTTGGQLSSSIDGLANGGFVVTWVDGSSNGSDIFFRLYNNSGVAQTSEILVNDSVSGSQHLPTVSALEDGGFVISFTESSASGDGQGSSVFAQQYDATGAKKGDNFLVNVSHEGGQSNSTVEALDNGDFVVGWYDASHDLLNRVYSVSDSELVA